MNCKLGGEIWGVTIPVVLVYFVYEKNCFILIDYILQMKNIMIVGMDLYKDSSQKNMSVVAFVSTTNGVSDSNLTGTKFFSRCALQEKGQEFADGLEPFMKGKNDCQIESIASLKLILVSICLYLKDALLKYTNRTGKLPDKIFVYRDGVSDAQFSGIKDFEVVQMNKAFKSVNPSYEYAFNFY